ncbi:MAG: RNA polymerase sigma factor [Oscillospiraceae bacterium]|nr:RNA polymerase sigma factor [Oscillospiraceae bacterium]
MLQKPVSYQDDAEQIIANYSDMVYRLAVSNLKSRADADDVYQDVFLKYMKEIKKGRIFESEEHIKSWLIRVTINCCRSLFSSAWFKKTTELDDNITDEFDAFSDCGYDLHNALMQIPQKYRSIIHLYYFEQYSTEEIAEITGEKSATVRTKLARAREKLREILKGDYLDE